MKCTDLGKKQNLKIYICNPTLQPSVVELTHLAVGATALLQLGSQRAAGVHLVTSVRLGIVLLASMLLRALCPLLFGLREVFLDPGEHPVPQKKVNIKARKTEWGAFGRWIRRRPVCVAPLEEAEAVYHFKANRTIRDTCSITACDTTELHEEPHIASWRTAAAQHKESWCAINGRPPILWQNARTLCMPQPKVTTRGAPTAPCRQQNQASTPATK